VKCVVAGLWLVWSHDGVGKNAEAIIVSQPLLTDCHWAVKERSKWDGEQTGAEGGRNRGLVVVCGSDAARQLLHVPESEKAVGAIHGIAVVFPQSKAERPKLFDEDRAQDVAPEDVRILGFGFASEIIGSHPGRGDTTAKHIGPSNGVLMVEGIMYQASKVISRVGNGMWPDGNCVIQPIADTSEDGVKHVGAYFLV
jgi:hypothetical protein